MGADRASLHDESTTFFDGRGSGWLKLTPGAAKNVCAHAADLGFVVVRVEGGLWHAPGFEARIDCIWEGIDPPVSVEEARENNMRALPSIEGEEKTHGAFIITTAPISGYEHKGKNAI
jgi:hypothetical protein